MGILIDDDLNVYCSEWDDGRMNGLTFIYMSNGTYIYGLWKNKLWAWWLGFLLNLAAAGTLVYSVIDDGWRNSDATDIALPVVFIVLLALFVMPAVRRHYWIGSARMNGDLSNVSC